MAESFDPYYKWLAIPPAEQPPNHYRLLGIPLFEADLDVISHAADQRMAHVRTFQSGSQSVLSQKLLDEISAARICLLDPLNRGAYDASLRDLLAPRQVLPTATPIVAAMPVMPTYAVPTPAHGPLAPSYALPVFTYAPVNAVSDSPASVSQAGATLQTIDPQILESAGPSSQHGEGRKFKGRSYLMAVGLGLLISFFVLSLVEPPTITTTQQSPSPEMAPDSEPTYQPDDDASGANPTRPEQDPDQPPNAPAPAQGPLRRISLMPLVQVGAVLEGPAWLRSETTLISPHQRSFLKLPVQPTGEYRLVVEATRVSGNFGLGFGIVGVPPRKRTLIWVDGDSHDAGLTLHAPESKSVVQFPGTQGRVFDDDARHKVEVVVTSSGVEMFVDGSSRLRWSGSFQRFMAYPHYDPGPILDLFLLTESSFRIHDLYFEERLPPQRSVIQPNAEEQGPRQGSSAQQPEPGAIRP